MVFIRAPMPTIGPQQGGGQASRASFRPPWVKEAPPGLPMPTAAPWMRAREARVSRDEGQPSSVSQELIEARDRLNAVEVVAKAPIEPTPAPVRRLSKITIIPSRPLPEPVENGVQAKPVQSNAATTGKTQEPEAEPQAKQTQATPVVKVRTQGQPKQTEEEPQAKQTQATPVVKVRTQGQPKQTEAEPQAKQTQATQVANGKTQGQPKQTEAEPQAKQTQATPISKGKIQGQPKQTEAEPQAKQTQATPVSKGKIQGQPKQIEAEPQAKQTQATPVAKGKTQGQPKQTEAEPQAKQTQATPVAKGRTQGQPKQTEAEPQAKQTQATLPVANCKTQGQSKQAEAEPKEVVVPVNDKIQEQLKQAIPVKERYKDGKSNGPREKRISIDVPHEKKAPAQVQEKSIPVVIKTEVSKVPVAPPPPVGPPMPPPPPPTSGMKDNKQLSKLKIEKIESLKSRPRRRPDWGTMMKEIESGKKLNHIVCNDRSAPLLATPVKVKEQFMYESEKPNVHNRLLEQIQGGVQLKRVKTNDRSKPILDGLRKFRRQMTIEEQTQKEAVAVLAEPDELDDIDKVRDDLQSTKQMLALELRNKEAMERENKRLQARLLNLEVELEKERNARLKEQTPQVQRLQEEEENRKLKTELTTAQKMAEEMENKYHETAGQLEMTRGELEDLQRKTQILERRMSNYASRDGDHPITKQPSAKRLAKSNSAIAKQVTQVQNEDEESEYEEETDSEEESSEEEEDEEALQERRTARELKLLTTKVTSFKDKEEVARKERASLKDQLKKLLVTLKEEKKRYKVLQKEVESMASVLKEDEEESEEDEEETESETESESESEASEEESEGDLPPEAPLEDRKKNLTTRSKKHENTLAVLKKGNYMLKANVDRVKDDLFKQKEMAITLQEDLNAVLAELG